MVVELFVFPNEKLCEINYREKNRMKWRGGGKGRILSVSFWEAGEPEEKRKSGLSTTDSTIP